MRRGFLKSKSPSSGSPDRGGHSATATTPSTQAPMRRAPNLDIPTGTIPENDRNVPTQPPGSEGFTREPMNLTILPRTYDEPHAWCMMYMGTKDAILNTPGFWRPMQDMSNPPYTIQPVHGSEGAGLGVFATRDIQPGELVISERPLLILPLQMPIHDTGASADDNFTHMFSLMYDDVKQKLFELHNCKGDATSLRGIISTNGVYLGALPGPYKGAHGAVCHQISRVNHSCSPNTSIVWDLMSFSYQLRALRPIPNGSQIFIAYHDTCAPREERRRELKRKYDFDCSCSKCLLYDTNMEESRRSDMIRNSLRWHRVDPSDEGTLRRWLGNASLPDDFVIKDSLKWLEIMENEGVWVIEIWVPHVQRLVKAYCALEDSENAKKWAMKGAAWTRATNITDGGWDAIARNPEKTDWWGLRRASIAPSTAYREYWGNAEAA